MAAAPVRVAVVGTGFGQKVHIPGLQAHHRTEVVAVYHRDLAKARAIAADYGIPHACDTVEAIVALPEVEAVSVSTPPFLHHAMARTVLQANKHLLLEKPTALSTAEAQELADLAQQRNLIATMDFEFRFVPEWQRLAELLAEGYVGNLRFVKIDWTVPGRANPERPWNWYARKDQGGGALGAFASHTFDYITWLFGPIQRLCARLSTAIPQRPTRPPAKENRWMPTTPVAWCWIWPMGCPARWPLAPSPMRGAATGSKSMATGGRWCWAAIILRTMFTAFNSMAARRVPPCSPWPFPNGCNSPLPMPMGALPPLCGWSTTG
jgi:predicted dehydrogenase